MEPTRFDAPVPGESLTNEPGNANWERPPQFAKLDDAAEYLFAQMQSKNQQLMLLALVDKGIPIEMIADVVLFSGFSEGKWSVDVAMLLKPPLLSMISAMAVKAGVGKDTPLLSKDRGITEELVNLEKIDFGKMNRNMSATKPEAMQPARPQGGFLQPMMGV